MNKKSTIPISALVVAGTLVLASINDEGRNDGNLPGPRQWLGYVVVFTMISAAADLGAPFAGGFAILVMITVLLTRGLEALQFVTGKITPPKKRKRGGRVVPAQPSITTV